MKNDLKVRDFIQCYSMKDLVDRHTELTKLGYKLSLCYEKKTVKRAISCKYLMYQRKVHCL